MIRPCCQAPRLAGTDNLELMPRPVFTTTVYARAPAETIITGTPGLGPEVVLDWKKWLPIIALALAALLLLTRQPKKKRRRKALTKARAGYRQKVGRIEARYK